MHLNSVGVAEPSSIASENKLHTATAVHVNFASVRNHTDAQSSETDTTRVGISLTGRETLGGTGMTEYRCYFLGAGTSFFGMPHLIEAAEDLRADTDEQARVLAERMYFRRRNHVRGFELWQGNRLVHQAHERHEADVTAIPADEK